MHRMISDKYIKKKKYRNGLQKGTKLYGLWTMFGWVDPMISQKLDAWENNLKVRPYNNHKSTVNWFVIS